MRRRVLVLALVFAVVYAATYLSGNESAVMIAISAVFAFGFGWLVSNTIRAGAWPLGSRRGREARYGAAVNAAYLSPGHHGSDCSRGSTDAGGCGDFGG